MVYDGDCNFCKRWIQRWQRTTGEQVEYAPYQDPKVVAAFPEIPREQFEIAVQLIATDGAVYSAAQAVFRSLALSHRARWLQRWYDRSRLFAGFAEWTYRFVARHRRFFSAITRH